MQYFGSINYYLNIVKERNLSFLLHNAFKKEMAKNRMWLMGPNNVVCLSIPLEGGRNNKMPFGDVKIADESSWKRIHWRTIHDSYRKSPWFDQYVESLIELYKQSFQFLWEWNYQCVRWTTNQIKDLDVKMSVDDLGSEKDTFSFSDGKPFFNVSGSYPKYQQVFSDRHGFIANLSILDLLFNMGPESYHYIYQLDSYKSNGLEENEQKKT